MMRVRQLIRPDIMVSAIAHLSVLALIFVFAEVRRFNEVATAPIAVDLVTPEEIESKPQPEPAPPPQLPSSQPMPSPETTASPPPAASRQAAEAAPPKQAPRPDRREAAVEQKLEPQQPPPSPAPPPPSSPNYTPPEPDLTVKYHVMLGLPEDTPVEAGGASSSRDVPGDGIDATASSEADLSSSVIEQFRRHLKTCSKLPAQLAPSDKVIIKLRVLMTRQGTLAGDPILIEASASAKGPLLMQSAMAALKACQPYGMLPVDRYGEWKVIDLVFRPTDFSS